MLLPGINGNVNGAGNFFARRRFDRFVYLRQTKIVRAHFCERIFARRDEMCSHDFGLSQVDEAIKATAGKEIEGAIHVTVNP